MRNNLFTLGLIFICFTAWGQNANGIKLNTMEAYDGYSFIMNNDETYLIDNCGEIINVWEDINFAYYHPKIWDNGNIIYIKWGSIYEVDWDGNIVNQVTNNTPGLEIVYEVHILPNGNYLTASRRSFTSAQFTALGYNIPGTNPDQIDGVVELDRNTGEVVWEWNVKDHVIQERDQNANNYGDVSAHPELINMDAISTFDWTGGESFMINSLGYNAERDEIIISMRKMCEIMIIDHSTTAAEAMGHTGGRHGKGGDIIYRWGNPQNYGAGTEEDQYLFYQHNPHWINIGEHKGKLMAYSNGLNRPGTAWGSEYSTVPIFTPPLDENDHYILEPGQAYQPLQPEFEYRGDTPGGLFYSGYTSGADFLPNGNLYVTLGQEGKAFELNPDGQIVWEYVIYRDGYIYRSHKYPKDHIAFQGKDLTPEGTIENPPSGYDCELFLTATNEVEALNIKVAHDGGNVASIINKQSLSLDYKIVNLFGQQLKQNKSNDQEINLDLSGLPTNNYLLIVTDFDSKRSTTYKLIKI